MPICQESFCLIVLCICHTPPVQPWTHTHETACISCHVIRDCRLLVQG